MMAVAWINDGDVYVALSRGGGHFQVRLVDSGNSVSLAFSSANRLHMAYERNGEIYYRVADQGTHPADSSFLSTAGIGTNPQIALDARQWAHIIYESGGNIQHASHQYEFYWQIETLGTGTEPTILNGQPRFGTPPVGSRDFAVAYLSGNNIQVRVYGTTLLLEPGWLSISNIPAIETISGTAQLDGRIVEEQFWMVATWMSKRPFPQSPLPLYSQPLFEAVNPLYPHQIGNPHQIYTGLNAVGWQTTGTPFDAGLKQSVN